MRHRSRAQVVVWVAVLVPLLFLPIVGLSIDAGVLFDARRDLQNVADSAARTAAMMIDEDALRTGRGDVRINVQAARLEAQDFLQNRAHFTGNVDTSQISSDHAVVVLKRQVRPRFLRMFGAHDVTISAIGRAQPCSGITRDTATCTT